MLKKGGAAFETAGHLRIGSLPVTPTGQWFEPRQIVAIGYLLNDQIEQWGSRFADGKPRMRASLDQDDGPACPSRNHGEQRAGKSRTDDGKIEVAFHVEVNASSQNTLIQELTQ